MNYDYDASYLDAADAEAWPNENEAESYDSYDAEARRRRTPPPVRPAAGRPAFRPRPGGGGGNVTQAQLEAALARVRQDTVANARAVTQVDGRVRTVIADQQKLQAETRKSVDKVNEKVRTLALVSAVTPLIAPPGSALAPLASLFPLLATDVLAGGQPGQPGQSGSGILNNQNTLLIAAVVASSAGLFDKK